MQKIIRLVRGLTRLAATLSMASVLVLPVLAQAAVPDIKCPDGKAANGIQRVGSGRHCLLMRVFDPVGANARVLIVYLHGDSGGSVTLPADSGTAFNLSQQLKIKTIALQRPGYRSELGLSDGYTSTQDGDYAVEHLDILAAALGRLRVLNSGKKILLVGHAGGAAMAALLASRFSASADAYLLAACPCDLVKWQKWRNFSAGGAIGGKGSLSPQAEVENIKATTRIGLVVGNKDDNILPIFSQAYAVSLQAQGVKTRLTYAVGATHVSVQRSPEFFMLAQALAADLSR